MSRAKNIIFSVFISCLLLDVLTMVQGAALEQRYGLTETMRKSLVKALNDYRGRIASGRVETHPKAANLRLIEENSQLNDEAKKLVEMCSEETVDTTFMLEPFGSVYALYDVFDESVESQVNRWSSGSKMHPVIRSCDMTDMTCRRFEQIVSQYVTQIGCASYQCGKSKHQLVCLFTRSHPTDIPAYVSGEPCSQCPDGFEMCLNSSLCVSSSYCSAASIVDKSISCRQSSSATQKREKSAKSPSLLDFKDLLQSDEALQREEAPATECADKRTECADWAQAGYCESDSVIENCPLSCQKCGGSGLDGGKGPVVAETTLENVQAGGCIDQHPNCGEWAKTPINCQSPYLKENCQRACGFCVILESTPPPPKINCNIDEVAYCTQISSDKEKNCAAYPKIRELCPITCGLCGTATAATTGAQPQVSTLKANVQGNCKDDDDNCPSWISGGAAYCLNAYVKDKCKLSCNLCQAEVKPTAEPAVSIMTDMPSCVHIKSLCNYTNVQLACPQTCATTPVPTTTVVIITDNPVCETLKGMCKTDENVKSLCPMTCMDPTTPEPTTPEPVTEHPGCVGVKSLCPKNEALRIVCPVTCMVTTTLAPSTIPTEPAFCPNTKQKCHLAAIRDICKITCAITTIATTTVEPDPEVCMELKNLCFDKNVNVLCPQTCINSTSDVTTPIPPTMKPDPVVCRSLKKSCNEVRVQKICPSTCESFIPTTPAPKQDSPYCELITSKYCCNSALKVVCPNFCVDFIPTTTAPPVTEPAYCFNFASSCDQPKVQEICQVTCARTTTPGVSPTCFDAYDTITPGYCQSRAEMGHCQSNIAWMNTYCMKTCQFCSK